MKFKLTILAACMALLAGCSGTPSESEMSSQIEQQMNNMYGVEFVKIESLEKTNGREEGENKYIADVSYDVVYTKSADQVAESADVSSIPGLSNLSSIPGLSQSGGFGKDLVKTTIKSSLGNFKAGDTKHTKAKIPFVKSENGWVLAQ